MAELLGVTQPAYKKWESDESKPRFKNLHKIASLYNIDVSDLLDKNDKISMSDNPTSGGESGAVYLVNFEANKELMNTIIDKLTQIAKLMKTQNRLMDRLIKKLDNS